MRRLGQPMELQALRRSVIDVDVEVVPQNVSYFFDGADAMEFQDILSDDGRAVRALGTPPEARVGLDVYWLFCDG